MEHNKQLMIVYLDGFATSMLVNGAFDIQRTWSLILGFSILSLSFLWFYSKTLKNIFNNWFGNEV